MIERVLIFDVDTKKVFYGINLIFGYWDNYSINPFSSHFLKKMLSKKLISIKFGKYWDIFIKDKKLFWETIYINEQVWELEQEKYKYDLIDILKNKGTIHDCVYLIIKNKLYIFKYNYDLQDYISFNKKINLKMIITKFKE